MKKIETLEDLRKVCDEETVKRIMMEYIMEKTAEIEKYAMLKEMIDSGASIKVIREKI